MLAHNVYFRLKDQSSAAASKLVEACRKYLNVQPGIVFFACGTLAVDLRREVNDCNWDVALHLVFSDQASHDAYQVDPTHNQFIDENKDNWAEVRVFDSLVTTI